MHFDHVSDVSRKRDPDFDEGIAAGRRHGAGMAWDAALKPLPERPGTALPPPERGECGKPMHRHPVTGKPFLTRPGRIGVPRRCFRCQSCGNGCFPLDRAPGLEGSTFTPGMAGVMAGTVPVTSFGAALRSGREKAVGRPLEPRMHLSAGGTGTPMRKEEAGGAAGRRDGGSPETREAKLAVGCSAEGRGRETGAAPKDRGSGTVGCLTGSAAAPSGGRDPSESAARLDRGAGRCGLHGAGEPAVISGGAEWTGNACGKPSGGRKAAFVPGMFHAFEYAAGAVKVVLPDARAFPRLDSTDSC